MKTPSFIMLCSVALQSVPAAAQSAEQLQHPFAVLRGAYAIKDPSHAAEAYTADARIAFQYPGMPREEYVGTEAIRASIERILKPIRPEWKLDMNFKLDPEGKSKLMRTGFYRIIVNMGDRSINSYGRFTVTFRAEDGVWRFAEDVSDIATETEYQNAPGPEMFAPQ
ncbi:MAG TPA: hypothetical protein VGN36_00060 [Sphingorhabdus sp.]|jgi:hypothetical protein|nr:hypothetical protein [Sphingorhabdus sp.]